MEQFFSVILLSIVIEGIITYASEWFQSGQIQWKQIASVVIGIVIAVAYKADLLELLGVISPVPYLGSILTGVLLSRGSNYIYDFISSVTYQRLD